MIRVLVGYKIIAGFDILSTLLQIKSSEMSFPGYVSSANLQNNDDEQTVVTMSTWEKFSDWKAWETSVIRKGILAQIEDKLADQPRVTIYPIMPTVGWLVR
jgi:heme-degrading monooxygenase HmoA